MNTLDSEILLEKKMKKRIKEALAQIGSDELAQFNRVRMEGVYRRDKIVYVEVKSAPYLCPNYSRCINVLPTDTDEDIVLKMVEHRDDLISAWDKALEDLAENRALFKESVGIK